MKFKNLLGFWILGMGVAFSQEAAPAQASTPAPAAQPASATAPAATASASETQSAPTSAPEAQPTAAPVAEAPVESAAVNGENAPEGKSKFDVLHGSAYNSVGNEAAASTVDGLRPDEFYGQKFLYVEPAGERGIVSIGSFFAGLDISGDLGRLSLGYAKEGFGIALHAALGQFHVSNDDGESHQTEAGDDLGFAVSKVLGGYALTLNTDWNTYAAEVGVDPEYGESSTENFRDLSVDLSFGNAPSAEKVTWTASVGYLRHESNSEAGGKTLDENGDSYIQIQPALNVGALALESGNARVFLGLNSAVPVILFDEYADNVNGDEGVNSSLKEFGLTLSPNILGEAFLLDNLLIFGEASYDWLAFGYGTGTDENGEDYSVLQSKMNKVNATMGVRFQHKDFFAAEFALGDSFFTDTKSIFNGEGTFVSFGAFLYF